MELYSVQIKQYKNLRDCNLDFSACNRLAVFAGVNGSGKSNFLEAIALTYHYFARLSYSIPKVDGCRMHFFVSGCDYDVYSDNMSYTINGKELFFTPGKNANLIIVYSGEFNRLLQMRFTEDLDKSSPSRNVVLLSAQSYQMLLLTKVLIEQRKSFNDSNSLLSLPNAVKLRYTLNAESVNRGEPPEDEIDYFVRELLIRNNGVGKCRGEISIVEFNKIMRDANPVWDTIEATTIYFVLTRLFGNEYEDACISDVQIVFEYAGGGCYTSDDLSEGEKWLVMYDVIYSCLADQDTLILLDEPDAYINETKKRDFVGFVKEYSKRGVFTIMTTHSPNIINAVNEKSLFGFSKDAENKVSVSSASDRYLQRLLVDDRMDYFSDRPIILFEGVSDARLVEGAIDYFVDNEDGYEDLRRRIKFDFISIGGSSNMVGAYQDFRKAFPMREVYVALDRDKAGRDVLKKLVDNFSVVDVSDGRAVDSKTRGFCFLIPCSTNDCSKDSTCVIEDYLPRSYIQSLMKRFTEEATCFHKLNNCKEAIKSEIRNNYKVFSDNEWRGFKPLIDFLVNLSK